MDLCLMIEGQDGLNWARWQRLVRTAEELGFAGLFRSDHFTGSSPPNKDSLELWTSLTWLASNTERLEFGPLVAPVSFRHPVFSARMGKDLEALSGGRFTLGVGGGWQEREHDMFGFPLLKGAGRFDRFEEGVEVIHSLLRSEAPVSFQGKYYQLNQAELLPRLPDLSRPPLLIGGNGRERTLPLVALFADEWNGVFITPDQYAELNQHLDNLLEQSGRPTGSVRRSIMTNLLFGRDQAEVEAKAAQRGANLEQLKGSPVIYGTASEVIPQIASYREAGAERIMLQWLEQDDIDGLQALAETVLPVFHDG
jgi:F420-dependent oxidoreductase-like protein